jgi:hypothetical protein
MMAPATCISGSVHNLCNLLNRCAYFAWHGWFDLCAERLGLVAEVALPLKQAPTDRLENCAATARPDNLAVVIEPCESLVEIYTRSRKRDAKYSGMRTIQSK